MADVVVDMEEENHSIIEAAIQAHDMAVSGFFVKHAKDVKALADRLAQGFENGNKLLLCGNGGSACDALHAAGEFVGRFVKDRRALPAIALTADPGILTAVGNDYGFDQIFSRQVEAHGQEGDVLIGISTSGGSENVLKALATARDRGMYTVLLTGEKGEDKAELVDLLLAVPSGETARIQETHIMVLQLLVALVEAQMNIG